ncbi:MAG: glycosyltransferase [Chitinophagaceae bacterium]
MQKSYSTRVLIITSHFAPAYKAGGIVRSLENLVRCFDSEFKFYVLTGNTDLNSQEKLNEVTPDTWTCYTGNCNVMYLSEAKRKFGNLKEIFEFIKPDVVYINGLYSIPFTIFPLWILKEVMSETLMILAPWGMLHRGNLAMKPLKKRIFLALFKILGFHKNVRWHATDLQEKLDVMQLFGPKSQVVLADAVPRLNTCSLQPIAKSSDHLKLITVSLITPNKGHLRLLRALKELQNEISVEYHIYGPIKDDKFWKVCQQEIKTLSSSIEVHYHGFIDPATVTASLLQCHFFVLPTQGENFCQAIHESLLAGRPVIISDQTPWKKLQEQQAGWEIDLQDKNALPNALKMAYHMDQVTYDGYCKGAQAVAHRCLDRSRLRDQYQRLFVR